MSSAFATVKLYSACWRLYAAMEPTALPVLRRAMTRRVPEIRFPACSSHRRRLSCQSIEGEAYSR